MKKNRKEIRMNRRRLKGEINRLHKEIYHLTHPPISFGQSLRPQKYRVVQRICKANEMWRMVNTEAEIQYHKNAMLHKLIQDLAEKGYIKITMNEDADAVELSLEITVLPPN